MDGFSLPPEGLMSSFFGDEDDEGQEPMGPDSSLNRALASLSPLAHLKTGVL